MAIRDLMELLALREAQMSQIPQQGQGASGASAVPQPPQPPQPPGSPGMSGIDSIFGTPETPQQTRSMALLNAGLTLAGSRGTLAEGALNALRAGRGTYAAAEQAQSRAGLQEALASARGPEDVLMIARQMIASGDVEGGSALFESIQKEDKDKATVESDSPYKTALSEFVAQKFGRPVDIHQVQLTPSEAMQVAARADQIRRDSTPQPAAPVTPEKTLGPDITSALVVERENARGALRTLEVTQDAARLLNSGVFTGRGSAAVTEVAAVLDQLGLLTGREADRLSATQEYLATVADLVLAEVQRAGSGGLRGLTDAERKWLTSAYGGNIGYTQSALFSIARKLNRRAKQQALDYARRADTITRGLSPEQREFFRLEVPPEAIRDAGSAAPELDAIMRGKRP
jgi:hypothetical protein